jgi:dissimilatory sulfite reductase (desulfoviridin) alpha/beta subunit
MMHLYILIGQIARETKVVVGGKLYRDALSVRNGPVSSYLAMIWHNVSTIVEALKSWGRYGDTKKNTRLLHWIDRHDSSLRSTSS